MSSLYASHLHTVMRHMDDALRLSGHDQIVIHSGVPKVAFQDDYHYGFKPNPNFLHWLPLTAHPHSFVVYRTGARPQLIFLQPHDYWHVVPSDPQGDWVEHFDIHIIRTPAEARTLIHAINQSVYIGEDVAAVKDWGFALCNPPALLAALHWQRAYKTAYEVECLAAANMRAARAHHAARDCFMGGGSEFDIHLAYLRATQHAEHELPYGNIIALNEHGAVLHYTELERIAPTTRHSLLIDAGASVNGYAADITRTYAAHHKESAQQNEFANMVQAMDAMQLNLIADIRVGQPYLDVHIATHLGVATLLNQFDFVRDLSVEAIISSGLSSAFFPHGIGHLLGLQVHDIGGRFLNNKGEPNPPPAAHPYLRLTRPIERGMVFTIEPGLYFIDMLLDQWKNKPESHHLNWEKIAAFKCFGGIRIEDNVLVTENGTRNLTREAFAAQ